MIRRFLDWLFRQGMSARSIISNRRTMRRLDDLERRRKRTESRLRNYLQNLTDLQQKLAEESNEYVKDAEKVETLIKRYEQELESLRDRINIYENDILPTLIAANRKYREIWTAEAAVHVRRQTTPDKGILE